MATQSAACAKNKVRLLIEWLESRWVFSTFGLAAGSLSLESVVSAFQEILEDPLDSADTVRVRTTTEGITATVGEQATRGSARANGAANNTQETIDELGGADGISAVQALEPAPRVDPSALTPFVPANLVASNEIPLPPPPPLPRPAVVDSFRPVFEIIQEDLSEEEETEPSPEFSEDVVKPPDQPSEDSVPQRDTSANEPTGPAPEDQDTPSQTEPPITDVLMSEEDNAALSENAVNQTGASIPVSGSAMELGIRRYLDQYEIAPTDLSMANVSNPELLASMTALGGWAGALHLPRRERNGQF